MRADLARYYPARHLGRLFDGGMSADECWDLITHLPRDSATTSAIYADPDYVPADDDDTAAPEPTLAEYSPEVQALAAMHDLLASLLATVTALAGGKPPKVDPYPRPGEARRVQAAARLREQARAEWEQWCKRMGVEV